MNLKMEEVETKTLFFYGTLRDEEVREIVIGDHIKQFNLIDGYLIGYKLFRVKNANYPLILRDPSSKAKIFGLIATGIDEKIVKILDIFEGKNYSRAEVVAFQVCDDTEVISEIYMPKRSLQYSEEWIYEDWYRHGREFFFQDDFSIEGVGSPD